LNFFIFLKIYFGAIDITTWPIPIPNMVGQYKYRFQDFKPCYLESFLKSGIIWYILTLYIILALLSNKSYDWFCCI